MFSSEDSFFKSIADYLIILLFCCKNLFQIKKGIYCYAPLHILCTFLVCRKQLMKLACLSPQIQYQSTEDATCTQCECQSPQIQYQSTRVGPDSQTEQHVRDPAVVTTTIWFPYKRHLDLEVIGNSSFQDSTKYSVIQYFNFNRNRIQFIIFRKNENIIRRELSLK